MATHCLQAEWYRISTLCTVLVPPTFDVEPPDSVLVEQGQTVVLDCSAAGEPKPVVTWHRESIRNVPINSEDRVSVLANNSLRCGSSFVGY